MSNDKNTDEALQKRLKALREGVITDEELEAKLSKFFGRTVSLKDNSKKPTERLINRAKDEIALEQKSKRIEEAELSDATTRLLKLQQQSIISDAKRGNLGKREIKEHIYKIKEHLGRLESWLKITSSKKSISHTQGQIYKYQSLLATYQSAYNIATEKEVVKSKPQASKSTPRSSLSASFPASRRCDEPTKSSPGRMQSNVSLRARAERVDGYYASKGELGPCISLLKNAIQNHKHARLNRQSKQQAEQKAKKFNSLYQKALARGDDGSARVFKQRAIAELKRAKVYGTREHQYKDMARSHLKLAKVRITQGEQQPDFTLSEQSQENKTTFRP